MFRLGQIFTATELIKNYREITKLLSVQPQALLITHKDGERFVFVNAELFENLLERSLKQDGIPIEGGSLRDQIFYLS